ncbi:hypothetical protein L6452_40637 [Arctium lappa]|uniref:Uncharacterized protein n=1 Tax=Arctium lappa TaxID=4217 RepID=A0ACB8XN10_ARCLA|nr:hypothetical protein L6452_40637 [Arctium lappa]
MWASAQPHAGFAKLEAGSDPTSCGPRISQVRALAQSEAGLGQERVWAAPMRRVSPNHMPTRGGLQQCAGNINVPSAVSLNKSNLTSTLNTFGSAGGLRFPLLGFLGYNDYLGFEVGRCVAMEGTPKGCGAYPLSPESDSDDSSQQNDQGTLEKPKFAEVVGKTSISSLDFFPLEDKKTVVLSLHAELTEEKPNKDGVPKRSDEGTSRTKDGDLISNETVVANVQNVGVGNFETMADKGNGAATRGHSTEPVNEDTLTCTNSEMETVQGTSNPPNEKSRSSKDGVAMQAENLLGESEVVGNISHDVDMGKSVGDENGKKHSKSGINISPPSRDQPRGKGGELKVGQGAKPIKGILKKSKPICGIGEARR